MPKKTGHNCAQCSKIAATEARTKSCWDDARCDDRRSYHRRKGKINLNKRIARAEASGDNSPRTISIAAPPQAAAGIIFYRERLDGRVHAIAAEVWVGERKALVVEPVHCLGLSPAQVVKFMENVLAACGRELGETIAGYAFKTERHPSLCPIEDCPLKEVRSCSNSN